MDEVNLTKVTEQPRLLVIGGRGFIGRNVLRYFVRKGWTCSSLSLISGNDYKNIDGCKYSTIDASDQSSVESILRSNQFDYVINASGYVDHSYSIHHSGSIIQQHLTSPLNFLYSLGKFNKNIKRFIQIGSGDEYGDYSINISEQLPLRPVSVYGAAKASAGIFTLMAGKSTGLPVTVVRPFLLYGNDQNTNRFIPSIISKLRDGHSFEMSDGSQLRDFLHIDDFCIALDKIIATEKSIAEEFNIASGIPISIRDAAFTVRRYISSGKIYFDSKKKRRGEPDRLVADISKAKNILRWDPAINFEEGVKKTIDMFKDVCD